MKTGADFVELVGAYSLDPGVIPATVKKGLIFHLHLKTKKAKDYAGTLKSLLAVAGLSDNVNTDACKRAIQRVVESIQSKKRNLTRDWSAIKELLDENFDFVFNAFAGHAESIPLTPAAAASVTEITASPKKLKRDCSNCVLQRKTVQRLSAEKRKLKEKCQHMQTTKVDASVNRRLKQALARKAMIETSLRQHKRDLKRKLAQKEAYIRTLLKENARLKEEPSVQELRKLRRSKAKMKCEHNKCRQNEKVIQERLQRENKYLHDRSLELEVGNDALLEEKAAMHNSTGTISARVNSKTYSCTFRKAAYQCIENQVISGIIRELAQQEVDFLPDKSTISQFAHELGVISDLQVGEVLVKNDNLTLAWDATSIDADHLNEIHVHVPTIPPTGYILQVGTIAGGTTADYTSHIHEAISDITQTYALFHDEHEPAIMSTVVKHLKNTLTDRVAVNHCVVEALQQDLDIQLLQLKCNVHPLDGIAKKCRDVLKEYDVAKETRSDTFGREGCAVNCVYSMTKMRYKQGKGDPVGFKQFMRQENIKPGTIVRYVGNRLHLAGIFFFLRGKLLHYLKCICNNRTSLRTALKKDLENDAIVVQLRALGLLGKQLSGPWMQRFYANKDHLTNLEIIPIVKSCIQTLTALGEQPLLTLRAEMDAMGGKLDKTDTVLTCLQQPLSSGIEEECFCEVFEKLVRGTVQVLEKQLAPYLIGYLSNPTPDQLAQTKSAPIHNIMAEQVLGLTDHQCRRGRNATIGFIEGKVKSRKKDTQLA